MSLLTIRTLAVSLRSEERRVGKDYSRDWSSDVCSSDLLIFTTLAPQATFGWSLSIGEFAYDAHSGRQSVWDEASVFTTDLLDSFELYKADSANKADFVAFTKSNATTALTSEQWHHALEYVKQVTDYVDAPAMLANMPTEQTANRSEEHTSELQSRE